MEEMNCNVVQSFECLNASLANVLRMWRYTITPSEIFFLGKGFDFKIVNRQDIKQLESDVYISSFRYMDGMGIRYIHKFLKDESKAKQFVQSVISDRRFVALKIRSDYLTYNMVFKQTIAKHYINVIGYNEERNELYILDGDVPTMITSSYMGWVNMDTIIEGWKKTNCEYIEFFYTDCLVKMTDAQLASVIIEQLNNYMTEKSEEKGVSAIGALFEQLDKKKANELTRVTRDINYQIRVDGFWASREFLLNSLSEFGGYDELIQDETIILKKWNSLCMMCIKVGISKRADEIARVTALVQNLLEEEKTVLCRVIDKLSGILI